MLDKSMLEVNALSAYFNRFNTQISQYCVRAQIVAYYYSLNFLLDGVPSIRQSHFVIGRAGETKVLDSEPDLCPDPRYNQLEFYLLLMYTLFITPINVPERSKLL